MSGPGEAYMPPDLVARVLASAGEDVVLVGGQALAFWMERFGIRDPENRPAVSRDVDFFTPDAANLAPLHRFARAIHGEPRVLGEHAISALIGSAIAPAGEHRVYNVDLLHAVIGLEREALMDNAMRVTTRDGTRFRVMHPLDLMQSRNINLHRLRDKQDALGQLQLRLAIEVARAQLELDIEAILRDASLHEDEHERERAIFDAIAPVDEYSAEDAARKNAERYGIHLADAIPAWRIASPVFWSKQWQFLRARMSPDYAAQCEHRRS
jgi:hypothetical protein